MTSKLRVIALSLALLFSALILSLSQDSISSIGGYSFISDPEEESTFMRLRRSLFSATSPKNAQKAKFGLAEYYFKHNDYSDAFRDFKEYAKGYQPSESTLLAKVYLYKIALIRKDAQLADSLKKEVFNNSFILLFSEFKMLKYRSAFNNNYEIQYYLDNIKVFLNGELFEEIKP